MNLTEAEIQLLASIQEAQQNDLPATRENLEARADRFWVFLEDWSAAWSSLVEKGLVTPNDNGYSLTESGHPLAEQYHAQRPDLYWYYYQVFYGLVAKSNAHAEFCERVYGKALSQEGQVDMACFDDLVSRLGLDANSRVLDIGCGAGGLSEYISDTIGAKVTGMDYSASAIELANKRTADKCDRLDYAVGDLNDLELAAGSYDCVISIDSIYWAADKTRTIADIVAGIRKGGKLAILMEHNIDSGQDPSLLESDRSHVAVALGELGLDYEVVDYTEQFLEFWPRAREVAIALRDQFVKEGTELICDNWIKEAEEEFIPMGDSGRMRRYLYLVTV